jgi:hypothetical protein
MGLSHPPNMNRPEPSCRCGAPVTREDIVRTAAGSYPICPSCWELGRRRWFRPDSKAERIAALERSVALLESGCD